MNAVSIIIPSLNSLVIDQVIAAIHKQTWQPNDIEILVVGLDEHRLVNEDAQARFISTGIPVIQAKHRLEHGACVSFLDSDCVPRPTGLREMASYIEQHEMSVQFSAESTSIRATSGLRAIRSRSVTNTAWNRSGPRSMLPSYALFIPNMSCKWGFDESFLRAAANPVSPFGSPKALLPVHKH
jgi:hypothetical protein